MRPSAFVAWRRQLCLATVLLAVSPGAFSQSCPPAGDRVLALDITEPRDGTFEESLELALAAGVGEIPRYFMWRMIEPLPAGGRRYA